MKRKPISRGLSLSLLGMTAAFLCAVLASSDAAAEKTPVPGANGVAVFSQRCLLCHGPGGRAPQLAAMGQLKRDTIYSILTEGIMKEQAAGLSDEERHAVADYIGKEGSGKTAISVSPACPSRGLTKAPATGDWNGWSPDVLNSRFQPSPGLERRDIPTLRLKWAFVFPDSASASNQATLVRGRLFIGSWDGVIYALDPETGCSYWTFKADSGVRTAVTVVGDAAYFGDFLANVYALNAETGKLLWRAKVDPHPYARVTASLVADDGHLYVPVSSLEEGVAGDSNYACCTFRGSVVAFDLASGKQVWKSYTIDEEAKPAGKNKHGAPRLGPSGAAVWSTPTVDVKRGNLYVATGNNYSGPNTAGADAVIAFDLKTGAKRWVRSLRASDQWNASCMGDKANCPEEEGPDFDFGASPVLAQLSDGRSLLLAGQKSGMLYALDPDKRGDTVWETRVGKGNSLGGIEWGFAVDRTRAYVAIADWDVAKPTNAEGSVNAVDLATGKLLWRAPNPSGTCANRQPTCSSANAAAVTVVPGIVFAGSLDGYLRGYDAADGKIIWQFDTNQQVTGVNGSRRTWRVGERRGSDGVWWHGISDNGVCGVWPGDPGQCAAGVRSAQQ